MLLNQFKTTVTGAGLSSAASTLQAGSSRTVDSVLVARKESKSLQVRASSTSSSSSSEGGAAGWLKSSVAGKVTSKVAKVADTALHYIDGRHDTETVQYNGTAVVMKKLKVLGLDAAADAEDDASEVEGKNVSVQLVSNEVDPRMYPTAVNLPTTLFQRPNQSLFGTRCTMLRMDLL